MAIRKQETERRQTGWNGLDYTNTDGRPVIIREVIADGGRRELRTFFKDIPEVESAPHENTTDYHQTPPASPEPVSIIVNSTMTPTRQKITKNHNMKQPIMKQRGRPRKTEDVSRTTLWRRKVEQGKLF